jgi:tetratricopeptide (TPR) repeat protein
MSKSSSLAASLTIFCLIATCVILPALAQFPGKGDASDWSDALPYYNRANHYGDKGRYDEAVEDYKEAIARYPYDPDFYINLGFVYRKLEEYGNAGCLSQGD